MRFLLALLFICSLAHAEPSDFLENVGLSGTVAANALTISLKTARGNNPSPADPVRIAFRSSTASSGSYVIRKITSAISLVVPSGTSLGCASSIECELYVYALDNAGAIELSVSTSYWTEDLQTTTAITGGNSSIIIYSASARTAKPVRLLGSIFITEATAGTWATAPSKIRLMPFKIELGPQLYGQVQYGAGGAGLATTSGTTTDIPASLTNGNLSYLGNAIAVASDFRLRFTGLPPGNYEASSHLIAWAQNANGTQCEVYFSSGIGSFGYIQTGQVDAVANGPLFGFTMTGVQRTTAYVPGTVDFFIQWRRVAGGGQCNMFSGMGGSAFTKVIRFPLVNGK